MSNSDRIEGYVLAGGKSSRMGTDKALLKFGAKTFLENAIELLKPICGDVKVVLNPGQSGLISELPKGVPHIFDLFKDRGALGGIHAALNNCESEFAFILAVDLPNVTNLAIEGICDRVLASKEIDAVVPRQIDGRLQPLCSGYRAAKCLPQLEQILKNTRSASVQEFLRTIAFETVDQIDLSQKEDLFANVNDAVDYKNLSKISDQ